MNAQLRVGNLSLHNGLYGIQLFFDSMIPLNVVVFFSNLVRVPTQVRSNQIVPRQSQNIHGLRTQLRATSYRISIVKMRLKPF